MTHPWVMDNNCVRNIIQIQQKGQKLWPGHDVKGKLGGQTG